MLCVSRESGYKQKGPPKRPLACASILRAADRCIVISSEANGVSGVEKSLVMRFLHSGALRPLRSE